MYVSNYCMFQIFFLELKTVSMSVEVALSEGMGDPIANQETEEQKSDENVQNGKLLNLLYIIYIYMISDGSIFCNNQTFLKCFNVFYSLFN